MRINIEKFYKIVTAFNRTIVELKSFFKQLVSGEPVAFNRTIVELK